jgi:Tripartite tricarboxylate transporter TctB family
VTSTNPLPREGARRTPDLVFTVVLLVVFAGALLLARQWGFRASLVPTLVAGVGAGLSALHLVLVLMGRTNVPAPVPAAADGEADHDPAHVFATAGAASWRSSLLWVAGFFAAVYVVGLVIATVVFTAAYLRLSVRAGWRFSAIYAAAMGLLLWLVFVELLAIQIPEGLFA